MNQLWFTPYCSCRSLVSFHLLLVALLSASVLKITTLRNPPDMFCRSLPSELRLAIRRHLPCVVELVPMPTACDYLAMLEWRSTSMRQAAPTANMRLIPWSVSTRTWPDSASCSRCPRLGEAWRLQWCTRRSTPLEGRMARGRSTQWKLRTFKAETASCGGVMLENMWQTGPILLTPRRDFVEAVRDCFLYAIRCTRRAVTVGSDRAAFSGIMQIVFRQSEMMLR